MKLLRFLSGERITGTGNGVAIIPGGQVLDISMVPGANGSWVQIDESRPIWVPGGSAFEVGAAELGNCCGAERCDQWPGEVQVRIVFGQGVSPLPLGVGGEVPIPIEGDVPESWFVIYRGC